MALQYSPEVRNAKLDALVRSVGAAPLMQIWSGRKPSRCDSQETGVLLSSFVLPDDWMAGAKGGVISMLGVWQDVGCAASGEPGYFRIYATGGRCRIQGSVGTDMKISPDMIVAGQTLTVTEFIIRDNNG